MNCKFFECENLSRGAQELCPTHYQQQRLGTTSVVVDVSDMPVCAVSHCKQPSNSRAEGSFCRAHYQLAYRGIDPESRVARANGKTAATCWVSDCPRRVDSKGLCNYHARQARGGRIEVPAELGIKLNANCSFDGCTRPYISKGLCHSHYSQLQSGRKLSELRDWGKYTKGEHICSLPHCRRVAVSTGLCENHKAMQLQYKISVERMNEIWTDPQCSNPGCTETKRLHMDHDHITGEFRALLCGSCNTALGFLKEDPSRISGLREYIERFS